MKVQRAELLSTLEGVSPGLSDKNLIEQADCFVFSNGRVYTYDEETVCIGRSPFDKSVTGAVYAKKFLELLHKLPDEELDIVVDGSAMKIRGRGGRRGEMRLEADVLIPIDALEVPKKWTPLPEDFVEAVELVQSCAAKDGQILQICLHIHRKWIEACDDVQICRYSIDTGIKEPVLIMRDSISHIVRLGMTEYHESDHWLHFRNPDKLQLSCRRYVEEYPRLTKMFAFEGEQITLPKGLKDTLERVVIFLDEAKEEARRVRVELLPDKLRVTGSGAHGRWTESKKTKYAGKNLAFLASPRVLTEMSTKHNTCQASEDRLKVDGGKWQYVVLLDRMIEDDKAAADEASGPDPDSE